MWQMPAEGRWQHYLGHCIQDFEMMSLFVLFMHFYRKAYSKKQKSDAAVAAAAAELALQKTSADSDATSDTLAEEQDSISSDSSDEQS
jgi:hypothetical protein